MKGVAVAVGSSAVLFFAAGTALGSFLPGHGSRVVGSVAPVAPASSAVTKLGERGITIEALNRVVQEYCAVCHSDIEKPGGLSLETYDVDSAPDRLAVSEKMIRKLRAQIMPPPGMPRPAGDTLVALVETLEKTIDKSAKPNPGTRTFQRLNRPEYEHAIHDLLGLDVHASDWLPLDTKSANFDNIADVQSLSPTLLDAYLTAASEVTLMAVGDRNAPSTLITYRLSPFASQHPWDHIEGTPYGTRGGIVATHTFPADGSYSFRLNVGAGVGTRLEDLDVSIDGEHVVLLHYERGLEPSVSSADIPLGADYVRTEPLAVKAGQHKVSVAFVRRMEGPYEDLVKPSGWSNASNGTASAGSTEPPYLSELTIIGPKAVTGISETPSRQIIFSCRPTAPARERPCAEEIVTRLGTKAYRRPLTAHDTDGLMSFYDRASKTGGFEEGIRTAVQAILASPHFIFRFETPPASVAPGAVYRVSDLDLASRLSFFIWGTIPDEELLNLAKQHKLSDKKTLEKQVRRMLANSRAEALSTRFADQWLRLQDLDKVHPDAFFFPDYSQNLADAMRRETQLFFNDIVRGDHSVLDLFTADYTFVNEQLARHYGIPNVSGDEFRRVQYPDDHRRGLLGHGSILVQTSLGNRTSPVLRGKWVMEVLIGMPPPPPPPNVPDLEETKDSKNGKPLTTRERMEIHRANPTCRACHQYMDPIGLALDNFDVTAKWRFRENLEPLDTRGQMYDGTVVTSPAELSKALLKRPIPLVRSFTENLMAYALGRRVEDFDQPAVRAIVSNAEANGYRLSSFVLGIVNSSAFQYKRVEAIAVTPEGQR
jgi:hypothetical protein